MQANLGAYGSINTEFSPSELSLCNQMAPKRRSSNRMFWVSPEGCSLPAFSL